jgi:uncharacterized Zn-binding protein involved in type VI secretion
MPAAHRDHDHRSCGAETEVTGQSTVYVNGKLWAVEGDKCSHGDGDLQATTGAKNVYINGKHVIVAPGDQALPDDVPHNPPPIDGSGNVNAYDG